MGSNFRKKILIFILITSINNPIVVAAKNKVSSDLVSERIIQLERVSSAYGQFLAQLQKAISDSQTDINFLRGQVQENQYHINQISEQQKQISMKIDNVISSLNEQKIISNEQNVIPKSKIVKDRNDIDDYNIAVTIMQDKLRQDEAIILFQNFVKQYPYSIYQPNANYWLGQLSYNKGKEDDATYYFAFVVKNYPKSQKAPDSMYKVGLIMQSKGNIDKAKATYQLVMTRYPGTDSAKQAKKRLDSLK